jgi:hypothetical protein
MSSVTSCLGWGLFICFTCLHVPYSTVTLITCLSIPIPALHAPSGTVRRVMRTWHVQCALHHAQCSALAHYQHEAFKL